MRHKIKFVLLSFVIVSVFSCTRDNYLDFQPKGVKIPSKVADYRLLLDQTNQDDNGLSKGFNDKHSLPIYYSDNVLVTKEIVTTFFLQPSDIRTYLFDEAVTSPGEDDFDWLSYYNQIYTVNIVLDGLQTVSDGTPEEIAVLIAEAKLQRAYSYFNLVNQYSVHYNPETAATDLGVPIREGIELEGVDFTRASVAEVYELVIKDITENIALLDGSQPLDRTYRPSKAAAYGLLAKVYLYQGNYSAALEAVDAALGFYSTLRDINDDSPSAFLSSVRSYPTVIVDEQIIWFKDSFFQIAVTDELVALYEDNDLRRQWFASIGEFIGGDLSTQMFAADEDTANFSDGIITPDLYLMRAECNARLGNLAAANTDMNTLLEKRYETGTYAPVNITDQAALIDFVKVERRKELPKSADRAFDIKRYNLFDGDNISLTHTLDGQTVTLEANSKNWAFPIAPKFIQLNPEIEQNPRD